MSDVDLLTNKIENQISALLRANADGRLITKNMSTEEKQQRIKEINELIIELSTDSLVDEWDGEDDSIYIPDPETQKQLQKLEKEKTQLIINLI